MLVTECNQPTPGRTLTQHRKIAVSFRDLALYKIFQMSLIALRQLFTEGGTQDKLREQGLSLALQCLSFDFVGTCLDESAEDLGTIQSFSECGFMSGVASGPSDLAASDRGTGNSEDFS
eukprot:scaffold91009_cov49-Prasinocladus_malaysianus.AAC.3